MGSNTCHFRSCPTRSSALVCGPGSRWLASGTLDVERPLVSCLLSNHCEKSAAASVVASTMNLVSSKSGSKALAARVGGTLGPGHCLDAGRSGRVDDCLALGPGYSRRMGIDPLLGLVGMNRP